MSNNAMYLYFDAEIGGGCQEGDLSAYGNFTYSYGNVSSVTLVPLICVNGELSPLCDDDTNYFHSAGTLCTGYGYYG